MNDNKKIDTAHTVSAHLHLRRRQSPDGEDGERVKGCMGKSDVKDMLFQILGAR